MKALETALCLKKSWPGRNEVSTACVSRWVEHVLISVEVRFNPLANAGGTHFIPHAKKDRQLSILTERLSQLE